MDFRQKRICPLKEDSDDVGIGVIYQHHSKSAGEEKPKERLRKTRKEILQQDAGVGRPSEGPAVWTTLQEVQKENVEMKAELKALRAETEMWGRFLLNFSEVLSLSRKLSSSHGTSCEVVLTEGKDTPFPTASSPRPCVPCVQSRRFGLNAVQLPPLTTPPTPPLLSVSSVLSDSSTRSSTRLFSRPVVKSKGVPPRAEVYMRITEEDPTADKQKEERDVAAPHTALEDSEEPINVEMVQLEWKEDSIHRRDCSEQKERLELLPDAQRGWISRFKTGLENLQAILKEDKKDVRGLRKREELLKMKLEKKLWKIQKKIEKAEEKSREKDMKKVEKLQQIKRKELDKQEKEELSRFLEVQKTAYRQIKTMETRRVEQRKKERKQQMKEERKSGEENKQRDKQEVEELRTRPEKHQACSELSTSIKLWELKRKQEERKAEKRKRKEEMAKRKMDLQLEQTQAVIDGRVKGVMRKFWHTVTKK